MVNSCWAPSCKCRAARGSKKKMYRFPLSNKPLLNSWIVACKRLPPIGVISYRPDGLYEPNENARLCGCCHFVKGEKSIDPLDVDHVPTLFGHTTPKTKTPVLTQKQAKKQRRRTMDTSKRLIAAEALMSMHNGETTTGSKSDNFCHTETSIHDIKPDPDIYIDIDNKELIETVANVTDTAKHEENIDQLNFDIKLEIKLESHIEGFY